MKAYKGLISHTFLENGPLWSSSPNIYKVIKYRNGTITKTRQMRKYVPKRLTFPSTFPSTSTPRISV